VLKDHKVSRVFKETQDLKDHRDHKVFKVFREKLG
jgi:hypothetical protein